MSILSKRDMLCGLTALTLYPQRTRAASANTTVVDVTAYGAKGDGKTDDTDALLAAHHTRQPVYYPTPEAYYRISETLPIFADVQGVRAKIHRLQTGAATGSIFDIGPGLPPLTISGMILDGGYAGGTAGEFSHGINLHGATGVTLRDNVIRNIYGDCIYIGSNNAATSCSAISIHGNTLDNPRRCNIAIVCGARINIQGNIIRKRTDYVAAIDLEPNGNGFDSISHVTIRDNHFDCSGYFLYVTGEEKHFYKSLHGLAVINNDGRAKFFFRINGIARVVDPVANGNRFTATVPTGGMFYWDGVKGGRIENNVDGSACFLTRYRSNKFWNSTIEANKNRFC